MNQQDRSDTATFTVSATGMPGTGSNEPAPGPAAAVTGVRKLFVLVVIGCTALLAGCYISPEGGYYGYSGYRAYGGGPGYYSGNPYYYYGGVPYYSYGGRYFYYRGHQRCYVNGLPHGGHYAHGRSATHGIHHGSPQNVRGPGGYRQGSAHHGGLVSGRPASNVIRRGNVPGRTATIHPANAVVRPAAGQPARGNQQSPGGKGKLKEKQ